MDLAKIRKKLKEARHKAQCDAGAAGELPSGDSTQQHGPEPSSEPHKDITAVPAEIDLSVQAASGLDIQTETGAEHEEMHDSFETLSLDEIAAEKSGETGKEHISGGAGQRQQPEEKIPAGQAQPQESEAAATPPEAAPASDSAGTNEDEKEKARQKNVEILTFRLGGEDYAFRIEDIEEILKPQQITKVPRVGAYIMGISSLRGKIIPVMDLKIRLGLKGGNLPEKLARVLILRGPKGSIGVCVDMVEDVLRIPASLVQDPPSHLSEIEVKYLEGVALFNGKFISIMKTGEVLSVRDAI